MVAEGKDARGAYGAPTPAADLLCAFDEKEGAVPGKYKVQISKTVVKQLSPTEAANLDGGDPVRYDYGVPPKYTGFETSGLIAEIPDAGTTDLKFEMSSK